ncbi:MAG: hypothetical protein HYT70_01575 [Candidatus Aenigmarchaeota archaeon]|nr:hypothetical protein [Candidatus Aenigmarchaeota archaeon]
MKGVTTIIAAIIIVAISVGLTSTAYIWGRPLIEKRQETTVTETVFSKFSPDNPSSLPKIIEDVANNRGVRTFTVNADGIWKLDEGEDSIAFTFTSKTSNIAIGTSNPISLTAGVQCAPKPSPANGTIGRDSSSVVCANATSGDVFSITYKIYFRELYDNPLSPTAKGFKIDLLKDPTGLTVSSGRTVKIIFDDSQEQASGSVTLITKKIKILLI